MDKVANVYAFVPKAGVTAKENLARIIKECRDLSFYGQKIPFDEMLWPVGTVLNLKGRTNKQNLRFTKHRGSKSIKDIPLDEAFAPFAKAYILARQGMLGRSEISHYLLALKWVEQALLETGSSDPTRITGLILDRAAALAKAYYRDAYPFGTKIKRMADFLLENRLTQVPCEWSNPIPPTSYSRSKAKVGAEAEKRRKEMLPPLEAVAGLGRCFLEALDRGDVKDMILSAPLMILTTNSSRISEVLTLPANCLIKEAEGVSMRWFPAKGGAPTKKPIHPELAPYGEQAVEALLRYSAPARAIALWYEENLNRLYLAPELEHLRAEELLSTWEVSQILWGEKAGRSEKDRELNSSEISKSVRGFFTQRKLYFEDAGTSKDSFHIKQFPFAELEKAVLAMLPNDFPWRDRETRLKYSDALCITRYYECSPRRRHFACMMRGLEYGDIREELVERLVREYRYPSIFERLGILDSSGNPIKIRTHQVRHFLDTGMHQAGLEELLIAAYAGRKNVHQNTVYDHVSGEERAEKVRDTMQAASEEYGLSTRSKTFIPIVRSEFLSQKIKAGHTTDLGHCVHDFTMMPCQMHGEHIVCESHVVVKGDQAMETRLRLGQAECKRLASIAQQAANDSNEAARAWLEVHNIRVEHFDEILALLEAPAVPNGSFLKLGAQRVPSKIGDAHETRAALDMTKKELKAASMKKSKAAATSLPKIGNAA